MSPHINSKFSSPELVMNEEISSDNIGYSLKSSDDKYPCRPIHSNICSISPSSLYCSLIDNVRNESVFISKVVKVSLKIKLRTLILNEESNE